MQPKYAFSQNWQSNSAATMATQGAFIRRANVTFENCIFNFWAVTSYYWSVWGLKSDKILVSCVFIVIHLTQLYIITWHGIVCVVQGTLGGTNDDLEGWNSIKGPLHQAINAVHWPLM